MTPQGFDVEELDTSRPHPARMYDFYLGGRDNYEVDREAAQQVITASPEVVDSARANRDFLRRAVAHLARGGVRQFLDIGTGIPTSPNTHEVAQAVAPDARVAYVDNDPIVAVHAAARLLNTGNTAFALGDLRDPRGLLENPEIARLIDFDRPVALLLVSVLHFVGDADDPAGIVAVLRDALPAGSHLVLSHGTYDFHPEKVGEAVSVYRKATAALSLRSHEAVLPFFDGFELLDPGLVRAPLWRPDGPEPEPEELEPIGVYAGVGRKA
ncbi:SAM-dependent methyltransferase [Actinacidiphila epipremni]|uniref:SAM-dependent methyltransferase n=1 Tax=Actinacidiphila epipremni TaxID=2053013 RepID=A0ABX0ZRZ1_9ACTN|nr:SAM-dependent methyltransferase [Actinacidiphila epipremni]NJP44303.1 SAM-dependent methyltransferase [Actinacidiphila epipremni]